MKNKIFSVLLLSMMLITFTQCKKDDPKPDPAKLTISPASHDFGTVEVGKSKDASFTIGNEGGEDLMLAAVSVDKDGFKGSLAATTIQPGKSTTLKVTFTPAENGEKTVKVKVGTKTITLKGEGKLEEGKLSVTPGDADYGTVKAGESKDVAFTIKNEGKKDLVISKIALTGTNASEFECLTTKKTLAPGASSLITVTFKPTSKGNKTASLDFTTPKGTTKVALKAKGILEDAKMEVTATNLTFGEVAQNHSVQLKFLVKNTGGEDLKITKLAISGTDSSMFTEDAPNSFTLKGGEQKEVTVTFKPTSSGNKKATVTVIGNGITHTINLIGSGALNNGKLVFTANGTANYTNDFSNSYNILWVNQPGKGSVTLKNNGEKDITINSYSSNNSKFKITTTFPQTIGPGKTIKVKYSYKYTKEGVNTAKVTFKSNVNNAYLTHKYYIEKNIAVVSGFKAALLKKTTFLGWSYDPKHLDTNNDKRITEREARIYTGRIVIPDALTSYTYLKSNPDFKYYNPFRFFPNATVVAANFTKSYQYVHDTHLPKLRVLEVKANKGAIEVLFYNSAYKYNSLNRLYITSTVTNSNDAAKIKVPGKFKNLEMLYFKGNVFIQQGGGGDLPKLKRFYQYDNTSIFDEGGIAQRLSDMKILYFHNCAGLNFIKLPAQPKGNTYENIKLDVKNCPNFKYLWKKKGLPLPDWNLPEGVTIKIY